MNVFLNDNVLLDEEENLKIENNNNNNNLLFEKEIGYNNFYDSIADERIEISEKYEKLSEKSMNITNDDGNTDQSNISPFLSTEFNSLSTPTHQSTTQESLIHKKPPPDICTNNKSVQHTLFEHYEKEKFGFVSSCLPDSPLAVNPIPTPHLVYSSSTSSISSILYPQSVYYYYYYYYIIITITYYFD
jgi:hypothetical protein